MQFSTISNATMCQIVVSLLFPFTSIHSLSLSLSLHKPLHTPINSIIDGIGTSCLSATLSVSANNIVRGIGVVII